ncbi:MAG TPA: acyl-CoA dehydrogenase family protein [Dehalococcoidia bacterium]|nr:acyl-CoA dehydrogenase family protein [Dehalococcoidia bacterium]
MDFRLSAEDEGFRGEVRRFLGENWSGEASGYDPSSPAAFQAQQRFQQKLAEHGWLTLAWPKAYGGMGASHLRQLVFQEEVGRVGAPATNGGINLVGPCLMVHGTEAQKQRFLPPIARGEAYWCQGFSEPGSGSDLASLQLRAVRDGDDFVLNGQKIWTSGAQYAGWIHVLGRTDPDAPKHRGITYFMAEMSSPGISVRPIVQMNGRSGFNETFFENVRVPANQIIGEINRGWYAATTTLDFERSGIGFVVGAERTLAKLTAFAGMASPSGGKPADLPGVRARLAELQIEAAVGRWLAYRVAWMQGRGLIPNYESSMSKVYGTELNQRVAAAGINLLGLYGGLRPGSPFAPLQGELEDMYLSTVSYTIAAGTSEIQRNIIATRGLGLPRG